LISTGKQDWPKDISSANGTLAAYISQVDHKINPPSNTTEIDREVDPHPGSGAPGIHTSHKPSRLSILNGSHRTNANAHHGPSSLGEKEHEVESVLVFPDFKLVHVPVTLAGAEELWEEHLSLSSIAPTITNGTTTETNGNSNANEGKGKLPTWLLPYECIILLCSHKRRDNRCGIASTILAHALRASLEKHHWEVHTDLEDAEHLGPPLPNGVVTLDRREETLRHSKKRVLILTNSHMGGHKFAGNMIIYTASGAGVWYGRVSSHNVEPIVQETIMGGKVLPELLRGGINLGCRKGGSILDW